MCEKGRGGTLPYALLILLQSVLYGFGNPLSKIGFQSITVLWCWKTGRTAGCTLKLYRERPIPERRSSALRDFLFEKLSAVWFGDFFTITVVFSQKVSPHDRFCDNFPLGSSVKNTQNHSVNFSAAGKIRGCNRPKVIVYSQMWIVKSMSNCPPCLGK